MIPSENCDSTPGERLSGALQSLGFSSYEARCYVGLLESKPQTGYAVAKRTGVPQAKVYEALHKLVSRDVAIEIGADPVLFSAVPTDKLLSRLNSEFDRSRRDAASAAHDLTRDADASTVVAVRTLTTSAAVISSAVASLSRATRRAYVSASPEEIAALRDVLAERAAADVHIIVIDFSRKALDIEGLRVFRHASNENAIYRRHQARHIAVVVDSAEIVYAVAPDGHTWNGVCSDNAAIIAAVKGLIKHDIDVQQIYADFGPQLISAYGPGLQGLERYRGEVSDYAENENETTGEASAAQSG